MSSRSSGALDGSRTADRMSRRPGTRVGSTTEIAAGRETSSHSSRASDGSRPVDDTGRRPEHPAGVGLIIKNRDRVEIIRMVGTWYSTLPQKKGSQRSSRPPERPICYERKRRPERCTMRSWARSQGYPGPWPRREQQQGWR